MLRITSIAILSNQIAWWKNSCQGRTDHQTRYLPRQLHKRCKYLKPIPGMAQIISRPQAGIRRSCAIEAMLVQQLPRGSLDEGAIVDAVAAMRARQLFPVLQDELVSLNDRPSLTEHFVASRLFQAAFHLYGKASLVANRRRIQQELSQPIQGPIIR